MEFADFVRAYQDMVYSTALRIVASPQEAEDIAQEVFVSAYRNFGTLADNPGAGAWLRTAARNRGINHVTRYRRRFVFWDFSSPDEECAGPADDSDPASWLDGNAELLRDSLLRLPRAFRVPLVLYYYEGLDYKEIAEKLGVSLSKVKTDIFRGKSKLRDLITRSERAYAQRTAARSCMEST